MTALRGVAGAIAGFGVAIALIAFCEWAAIYSFGANTVNSGYMMASIVWTVIAAAAGGFVAARIAGTRELPWSAAVGFLLVMLSVFTMRRHGEAHPGWYETVVAGCGPVSALIGGAIRMLTKLRTARKSEILPVSRAGDNRRPA